MLCMNTIRPVKNILVTGGAGFIGSAFIRYLLHTPFEGVIVNFDALTYAGNLDNLREVEQDPRYFFEQGDIRNEALVEHLCKEHEIDTLLHFAAESHVDRSIAGPYAFMETNVMGTFHLLEVIRRNPHIHFHHVSTDEVYGSLGPAGQFNEDSPYQPNSPYSASKAASDHLVRAYAHTYNLSTCLSNCSNNYGPFQHKEKLIPMTIERCLENKPIPIYGNGMNVRDWLFVEDHVHALHLLLLYGKRGETYAIGGDQEWKNIDLVKEILRIAAKRLDVPSLEHLITFVADRPGHDARYAIDHRKITQETGWRPKHSFSEGLEKTFDCYQFKFFS